MKVASVSPLSVEIGGRLRPIDRTKVRELADSMAMVGLLQPILVTTDLHLVAGAHRLEAAKLLEWDLVDALYVDGDEIELEMREIAENLHRVDLSKEQRTQHIRRYDELLKQKRMVEVSAQIEPKRNPKGGRPATSNVKEIAAGTGLSEATVKRALKDDKSKGTTPPSNYPEDQHERSIKWRRAYEKHWNKAPSLTDQEWALGWSQRPIMDAA